MTNVNPRRERDNRINKSIVDRHLQFVNKRHSVREVYVCLYLKSMMGENRFEVGSGVGEVTEVRGHF